MYSQANVPYDLLKKLLLQTYCSLILQVHRSEEVKDLLGTPVMFISLYSEKNTAFSSIPEEKFQEAKLFTRVDHIFFVSNSTKRYTCTSGQFS